MELTSLYREPESVSDALDSPALECVDVFKLYRSGPVETVALRGLDLRVEPGEFVAVLGRSGSGKSTFLHLAAGLDDPSAGEVRAFGRPLNRMTEQELARYRASTVAIVLQSQNLWSTLTAQENVVVTLKLARVRDAERRAEAALATFGLGRRAQVRAAGLSGGEQQRVAIAAAAAREAPLVLADEPTGARRGNERIVLDSLAKLRELYGATIVTVTHARRVADAADRVVTFVDGRAKAVIRRAGDPHGFRAQPCARFTVGAGARPGAARVETRRRGPGVARDRAPCA
jgi:ABC-type lipoprotein export system ATPase subunit